MMNYSRIISELGFHVPSPEDIVVTVDRNRINRSLGREVSASEVREMVQNMVDRIITTNFDKGDDQMPVLANYDTTITRQSDYNN